MEKDLIKRAKEKIVLRVDNNQKEEGAAEADIRQRVEDWAKAIRAKVIDAVISLHTSDVEPGKTSSVHIPAPFYEVRELDVTKCF